MNIAILHYSVPPVVGGVESVIAHHARLMSANGHSVRLIAARGKSLKETIQLTSIPMADSQHPRVLAIKEKLDRGDVTDDFYVLRDVLATQLEIALTDVDVLIAHNVCSLNKNLALTAALHQLHESKKLPRLILWHHDLAWTTPRYRAELHDGYPWDLLRQAWPGISQVTVSHLRQQELAELLGIKKTEIMVIPNGVDLAHFHKLETQTISFINKLGLFDADPLLLLPVRITPRKNIELALHVLAQLQNKYASAKLVVSGPLGPHNTSNTGYFEKLKSLRKELGLEGSACFLAELTRRHIPDHVVFDLYHLADALLLPSREEGFGIPVLEAGLAGIPVFCSDIEPLQNLGGSYATYFSPDAHPQDVADLMAVFFDASPVFGLRSNVKQNYTWERVYSEKIVPLLKQ